MGIVRHCRNQRFGVVRYSQRDLLRTVTPGEPGAKWGVALLLPDKARFEFYKQLLPRLINRLGYGQLALPLQLCIVA